MQGVYWWLNLVNGKVYVGSSIDVTRRKTGHLNALRKGVHHSPHFQAAKNEKFMDSRAAGCPSSKTCSTKIKRPYDGA